MSITVRPEVPSDIADIEALTVAAFLNAPHTSHTEHLIVNALRESDNLTISVDRKFTLEMVNKLP